MSIIARTLKESLTRLAQENEITLQDVRIKIYPFIAEDGEITPAYCLMNKTTIVRELSLKKILDIKGFDILGKETIVRSYLKGKLEDLVDEGNNYANIRAYMKNEDTPSFYVFEANKAVKAIEVSEL